MAPDWTQKKVTYHSRQFHGPCRPKYRASNYNVQGHKKFRFPKIPSNMLEKHLPPVPAQCILANIRVNAPPLPLCINRPPILNLLPLRHKVLTEVDAQLAQILRRIIVLSGKCLIRLGTLLGQLIAIAMTGIIKCGSDKVLTTPLVPQVAAFKQ